MVPPPDNGRINTLSRSNHDSKSTGELLIDVLNALERNQEELVHYIKRNQIDINAFGDEPATGIVTVTNPIRQPVLITDIIATWNTTGLNPETSTASNTGTVATPGAGAAIVTVNVGPGTYSVQWSVEILAIAATTPDNMKGAVNGSTALSQSVNGTAIGSYPNQLPFTAVCTGAIQAIGIYAIAAEATGTYKATLVVTDVNTGSSIGTAVLKFGGRTFQLNYASGLFLATGLTNGFQMDNTSNANAMTLTVTPATACHLEICGEADYRKLDRL
jgi:hypothetical protein